MNTNTSSLCINIYTLFSAPLAPPDLPSAPEGECKTCPPCHPPPPPQHQPQPPLRWCLLHGLARWRRTGPRSQPPPSLLGSGLNILLVEVLRVADHSLHHLLAQHLGGGLHDIFQRYIVTRDRCQQQPGRRVPRHAYTRHVYTRHV